MRKPTLKLVTVRVYQDVIIVHVSSGCKHPLPDNCKEVECLFLSQKRPEWNRFASITIKHACDTSATMQRT